jgi:hypothetical protein
VRTFALTDTATANYVARRAQVAELVDALVSGTSGASREGSSPFLGTILTFEDVGIHPKNTEINKLG